MMYRVISFLFPVLAYVPFIPTTPIIVGLSVWVLHPKFQGEAVMYLIMSDYMEKFVLWMRLVVNAIFGSILFAVLWVTEKAIYYGSDKTSNQMLIDLRAISEKIDT